MPNLENLRRAIEDPKPFKLYDLLTEEEARELTDEILIFDLDSFNVADHLNDEYLADWFGLDLDEDVVTDEQRIEYGAKFFSRERLLDEYLMYSNTVFYKSVNVVGKTFLVAYFASVWNDGLGTVITVENEDFLGVFSNKEDIEAYLDSQEYLGFFVDEKRLRQLIIDYILTNWEY